MKRIIKIQGMTCMHCANRVQTALKDIEEVIKVKVNLKKNEAIVKLSEEINNDKISQAIAEVGYQVTEIV